MYSLEEIVKMNKNVGKLNKKIDKIKALKKAIKTILEKYFIDCGSMDIIVDELVKEMTIRYYIKGE